MSLIPDYDAPCGTHRRARVHTHTHARTHARTQVSPDYEALVDLPHVKVLKLDGLPPDEV